MSGPADIAWRSARAMWADDHASQALGMELVSVAPGQAVLRMPVRDDMVNGHGIGHGGLTFSLADSAFAFACNTYNRRTVAHSCEIRYHAPVRLGDVLEATAVERHRGDLGGVYDVEVRAGARIVATFVGHAREIGGSFFDDTVD